MKKRISATIYSNRWQSRICKDRDTVRVGQTSRSIILGMVVAIVLTQYSVLWTTMQVSAADNCTPERLLVPGGIATHDGSIGFFRDVGSGIVALRLSDGKDLWKTQTAQIPIGVVGSSLVAFSVDARVHVFDRRGKEILVSGILPGATGSRPRVYRAEVCGDENRLIVQWSAYFPGIGRGAAPKPGQSVWAVPPNTSTGVVLMDCHTGNMKPVERMSFTLPDDKSLHGAAPGSAVQQSRALDGHTMYLLEEGDSEPSIPYSYSTHSTIKIVDSSSRRTVWQRAIIPLTYTGPFAQPP